MEGCNNDVNNKNHRFCSKPCRYKNLVKVRPYVGTKNPFYGKKHTSKSKKNISIGVSKGMLKSEKFKKSMKNRNRGDKNPFYGRKHDNTSREKMSEARARLISLGLFNPNYHRGIRGEYFSNKIGEKCFFASFYEFLRMVLLDLDENVKTWTKRHNIRIKYFFKEKQHFYIPDFFVELKSGQFILEEIKGYEQEDKLKLKIDCLSRFCNENNFCQNFIDYEKLNKLCLEKFNDSIYALRKRYKKGELLCKYVL